MKAAQVVDRFLLTIGIGLALAPGVSLMFELRNIGMQEDAMIGLRHLRNLIQGYGLVYNRGETGLGVTDPLFWFASYLVTKPWSLFSSATLIELHYRACAVFLAGALIPLVGLKRRATNSLMAGMAALLSTTFFWPLRFLYFGLEGPFLILSVAALSLAISRWRNTREFLLAMSVGVATWNRPEIVLASAPGVLFYALLVIDRKRRLRTIGGFVAGVTTVPLALKILTGSFVAGTVKAKAYFGAPTPPVTVQFITARVEYLDNFLDKGRGAAATLIFLTVAIAIFDATSWLRAKRIDIPWESAVYSAFVAGYSGFVLTVPSLWEWYVSFWLVFCLILLGSRAVFLIEALSSRARRPFVIVASATALFFGIGVWRFMAERQHFSECVSWISQENVFRGRLSRELEERWRARSVWMEAAGWQGFFNDARVYDEVGLIDDKTIPLAEKYGCRYFVASLQELKPQFVIKRAFELERNRIMTAPRSCPAAPLFSNDEDRAWFSANYEEVELYQTNPPGYFGEYSYLKLYQLRQSI